MLFNNECNYNILPNATNHNALDNFEGPDHTLHIRVFHIRLMQSHLCLQGSVRDILFFYYKTSIWILLSSLRCTLASLGVASFDSLKYLLLPCTFWLIKHIFYPIVYIQNVFWHCCGFFSVEGKQPST